MITTATRWRLRTEHATRFRYSSPARASYNEVRQTPPTTGRQTVLESLIQTVPLAAQYAYRDYWGTEVMAFNVDAPHDRLSVHSMALVETRPAGDVPDVSWSDIGDATRRNAEYTAPSRFADWNDEVRAMGASLRSATPAATAESVIGWTNDQLEYVRGVTDVHTSATEAYVSRRGVCQDFAHLALSVLRASGIPARYVSGYLHPDDAPVGEETAGESHAWIEAWLGTWWGMDPTNAGDVGLRHVVVARGRDYADVAPVRGIFAGDAEHESSVTVRITRTI